MIDLIAIDGPVGVGKSTVAGELARRFAWQHLDTGAMYRAVAWKALRTKTLVNNAEACGELARTMKLEFEPSENGQRVLVNEADVTEAIREADVTEAVSTVADHVSVREELGRRQRELGTSRPSVAEGRDMGTVVFPQARWKFFLDADPLERARRRRDQLNDQGRPMDETELLASIAERDRRDRERPVGALKIADDAIVIDTTDLTQDEVVELIEAIVRAELEPAR